HIHSISGVTLSGRRRPNSDSSYPIPKGRHPDPDRRASRSGPGPPAASPFSVVPSSGDVRAFSRENARMAGFDSRLDPDQGPGPPRIQQGSGSACSSEPRIRLSSPRSSPKDFGLPILDFGLGSMAGMILPVLGGTARLSRP